MNKKLFILVIIIISLLSMVFLFSSCDLIKGISSGNAGQVISGGLDTVKVINDLSNALRDFDATEEYYIGRTVAATILSRYDNKYLGLTNIKAQQYANYVGQVNAVLSDRKDLFSGYIFITIDSPIKNAFAAPGGFVFITSGLISACDNEDQMAGILAHEISHVVKKHQIKAISQANRVNAIVSLIQKYGSQAAKDNLKNTVMKNVPEPLKSNILNTSIDDAFKNVIGDIVKSFDSGYSKDQEKEADIAAVSLMVSSGYNPDELINIIEKLKTGTDKHYSSHPAPDDRIAYIKTEISKLSSKPATNPARTKRFVKP